MKISNGVLIAKALKLITNDIKFPNQFKGLHVENFREFLERPIPENLTQRERNKVVDCTKDDLVQQLITLFGGDFLRKDGTVMQSSRNMSARL